MPKNMGFENNKAENEREGAIVRCPEKVIQEVKNLRANVEKIMEACEENPENKIITKEEAEKLLKIVEDMEKCI